MTTENQNRKKYPTHKVYFLTDKPGRDEMYWNKVGDAFFYADNDGMTVSLNFMGQKIPLVIRRCKPKD
jgi:hypothetical protein